MAPDAPEQTVRQAIGTFLAAVERRDADAVAACFMPEATYRNMPAEPTRGRAAIRVQFATILERSSAVRWEIVSAAYVGDTAWLERVDRFTLDGRERGIECNGVFRVSLAHRLLTSVRDYLDLSVWKQRIQDVRFP